MPVPLRPLQRMMVRAAVDILPPWAQQQLDLARGGRGLSKWLSCGISVRSLIDRDREWSGRQACAVWLPADIFIAQTTTVSSPPRG